MRQSTCRSSEATIQGSISNFSVQTSTAAIHKDLLDHSGQVPLPSSSVSHNSSNLSSGRLPSVSDHRSFLPLEKQTFGFRAQSVSTIRGPESHCGSTASSTPRRNFRPLSLPSLTKAESLLDDGDSQPLATLEISTVGTPSINPNSFLPRPTDRVGTTSRSHLGMATLQDKKGILGSMTHVLNSDDRPEISTSHDPLRRTHVGPDPPKREFIGLPKDWQRLLEDNGISKSDQERTVMEIVKFYHGDVWERTGHAPAPGSAESRSRPIPGATNAAYPGVSKSIDDSFVPTVGTFFCDSPQPPSDGFKWPIPSPPRSDALFCTHTGTRDPRSPCLPVTVEASPLESPNSSTENLALKSQATVTANDPVSERRDTQPPTVPQQQSAIIASMMEAARATLRRAEEKKEDRANDADVVECLQQICVNTDPTMWLYLNFVKIGQG
jgi:hypothetical protein